MKNNERIKNYQTKWLKVNPTRLFMIDGTIVECSSSVILNLLKIIEAKDDLLISYRTGRKPKQKTWDVLDNKKR